MAEILVLGGGFGGLAAAHELRRRLPADDQVTVVAASDRFFVGFAKLWDLGGVRPLAEGSRPLAALERHGIRFVQAEVTAIDPAACAVETTAGPLAGDGLVVALGAAYQPNHAALLTGHGHNLYDAAELPGIHAELDKLAEGTVLVSILGAPYLCPPAPFEAALVLDDLLRRQGRLNRIEVVVTTPQPLTLPVAGPDASHYLADRLADRGIAVLTQHAVTSVDQYGKVVNFGNGRSLGYGVLLGVPAAAPPPVVAGSPLAGPGGWIQPDPRTFATGVERVYAVGDCTTVPTPTAQLPKAGVFAEAAGRVAAANLVADLHGGDRATFDGEGFCFLELPGRQVATVTGNFYAEPRADVRLTPPDEASYRAKQQWEQERLAGWLG